MLIKINLIFNLPVNNQHKSHLYSVKLKLYLIDAYVYEVYSTVKYYISLVYI